MKLKELLDKFGDVEITEEQEKEIKDKLGIKESKTWKPKHGETFWHIYGNGEFGSDEWDDRFTWLEQMWLIGNCFKTKAEAEFAAKKIKVTAELKRFAEEHNEGEIDWKDDGQGKHFIKYDYKSGFFSIEHCFYKKGNDIYFTEYQMAYEAIKEIGEDRLKKYYFEVEE